ncbi:MAG TPA: hypothetical protein VF993_07510 [Myxococcales bacterium]
MKELLCIVREAKIADANLRDQALRAAKSACLNSAYAEFGISNIETDALGCTKRLVPQFGVGNLRLVDQQEQLPRRLIRPKIFIG